MLRPSSISNSHHHHHHPLSLSRHSTTEMSSTQSLIENHREGAEVYTGTQLCKQKCTELLSEIHLPLGLLPFPSLEEVGYNRATGFVWLKQGKPSEHYFKKIKKLVWYATEVSAFVEDSKMKKVSGVKSKELVIWVTMSDIYISDSDSGKITFKTPAGLSRTFPVNAFEAEDEGEEKKKKEADGGK